MNTSISTSYYMANVGIAWERTLPSKQTLFPIWGEKEERKPKPGVPPVDVRYLF